MRGRKNSKRFNWRGRKRAMLRLMLMAAPMIASPLMINAAAADSPLVKTIEKSAAGKFVLPPLPLPQSTSAAIGLKVNPFCQPAPLNASEQDNGLSASTLGYPQPVLNADPTTENDAVQLASGDTSAPQSEHRKADQSASVRLLPLDIQPQIDPLAGVVKGAVRANPMAEEQCGQEPITAPMEAPKAAPTNKVTVAKTRLKHAGVVDEGKSDQKVEYVEGPISFSLNDATLTDTSGLTDKTSDAPAALQPTKSNESSDSLAAMLRDEPAGSHPPAANSPTFQKGSIQLSKTKAREADPTTTISRGTRNSKMLLVPLPSEDDFQFKLESPVSDARIVKGARPRVDVGVLPVAIERTANTTSGVSTPVAHLTPMVTTTTPIDIEFETPTPTLVQIKRTEVESLKTSAEIRKVQIGDSSICAAVAAGSSQLQLIGIRDGVTRMAVWTAATDGKDNKVVYEIRVGVTTRTEATEPAKTAATLTQSSRAAFPDSDITVRADQGKMIVEGRCATNESAKQALRMIRAACLMPVVDRLTIR